MTFEGGGQIRKMISHAIAKLASRARSATHFFSRYSDLESRNLKPPPPSPGKKKKISTGVCRCNHLRQGRSRDLAPCYICVYDMVTRKKKM